jgi:hypothetical protein
MDNNYDNLKRLFDQLTSIGFWGRLFRWKKIRNLLIEASADLQKLQMNNESLVRDNSDLKISSADLNSKLSAAGTTLTDKQDRINELVSDAKVLAQKNEDLAENNKSLLETAARELSTARARITKYELLEEGRQQKHESHAATLKEIQYKIEAKRQEEMDEKHQAEMVRMENLKLTWSNHEAEVKQAIKSLCAKHTIPYVEKVPFKGEPDNTMHIAEEFIIFDAKSPRGEDLTNFPGYLRDQSEKAKKYAREENVKKWIFFVVPSNTLEVITTFVYPLADYEVFVITMDALEPIILSLKKIEEYDFADQMNPEDRENICRVLGKFAHLSKRRIQIDMYFINQFMELAYKSESDLPPDILEKVVEFEKAEKLNPPQEKRAKAIPLAELEKNTQKLRLDALTKGILIEDTKISTGLNGLPLYRAESSEI